MTMPVAVKNGAVTRINMLDDEALIHMLRRALDFGGNTHTLTDVAEMIRDGRAQLFKAPDAVIVTQVHSAPRALTLHFWLAAGRKDAVIALSREVMDWGRQLGCDRASMWGRAGWIRVLAREGWRPEAVVLRKSLQTGE